MSGVLLVLSIIGGILLLLVVIMLVLLLLILFVPIRYRGQFSVDDPEPQDAAHWGQLREHSACAFVCSWFGPLIRCDVTLPGDPIADIRIAWMHINPLTRHPHQESDENPDAARGRSTDRIYDRVIGVYRKADYYWRVLRKEETAYTFNTVRRTGVTTLRRILPRQWEMTGTIGLGDPAMTARVLEIHGVLYPLLAGHVAVEPVFLQWQMDAHLTLKGHIRLIHVVTAVMTMVMDRRIRQTIRRLRNADKAIAAHYNNPY